MKVYAVSDLHLSSMCDKPMDIFGGSWENYWDELLNNCNTAISVDDIILISGDISWAMTLDEAVYDLKQISLLPGTKILIRGNHDYWWKSISRVRENLNSDIIALQNDAVKKGNFIFCGTRGWTVSESGIMSKEDKAIFEREIIRLELSLKEAQGLQKNSEKIIALIHFPPFNSKRQNSAFTDLFEKYKVDIVIYGHLHGKDCLSETRYDKNGIKYFLTSIDILKNKPVLIAE